jgi:hypothetical protein
MDRPFFRMVTPQGPRQDKALTFSSLRHNFTRLAQRDGFKDQLRVHGIRGGVANKIDRMALPCTCYFFDADLSVQLKHLRLLEVRRLTTRIMTRI